MIRCKDKRLIIDKQSEGKFGRIKEIPLYILKWHVNSYSRTIIIRRVWHKIHDDWLVWYCCYINELTEHRFNNAFNKQKNIIAS